MKRIDAVVIRSRPHICEVSAVPRQRGSATSVTESENRAAPATTEVACDHGTAIEGLTLDAWPHSHDETMQDNDSKSRSRRPNRLIFPFALGKKVIAGHFHVIGDVRLIFASLAIAIIPNRGPGARAMNA